MRLMFSLPITPSVLKVAVCILGVWDGLHQIGRKGIWDVGCDSGGHQGSEGQTTQTKRMKRNKKRKLIFSIAKRLLDDGTVV